MTGLRGRGLRALGVRGLSRMRLLGLSRMGLLGLSRRGLLGLSRIGLLGLSRIGLLGLSLTGLLGLRGDRSPGGPPRGVGLHDSPAPYLTTSPSSYLGCGLASNSEGEPGDDEPSSSRISIALHLDREAFATRRGRALRLGLGSM